MTIQLIVRCFFRVESSEWYWTDGSSVDVELWAPNEPNGVVYPSCVRIYANKFPGSWDDVECTKTEYAVCKTNKSKDDRNEKVLRGYRMLKH